MSRNKRVLIRLGVSAVLLAGALIAGALLKGTAGNILTFCLFAGAWIISGYDVLFKAVRGIFRGQLLDENFLMTVSTVGAFILAEYAEAALVMMLYQLGEVFQRYAVGKSRKSVAALTDIRPDRANLLIDGEVKEVDPEEVNVGDLIVIRPGERIPLDGEVTVGASSLDTSALTGESLPREVTVGGGVISGCINLSGVLTVKVTRPFAESTVSRILELTENAAEKKSPAENFITRFARVYTPAVVGFAVLLCVIPSLIWGDFGSWLRRALMLLMVSCPCALVISVPLGFFGGIGAVARRGILIKGSGYMEVLAEVDTAVFDKTGTLTEGRFTVSHINAAEGVTEDELLILAVSAEQSSTHPLALGIVSCGAQRGIVPYSVSDVTEFSGRGVACKSENADILVGSKTLLAERGIDIACDSMDGSAVYVTKDGKCVGSIILKDVIKSDTAEVISRLKRSGIKQTVMLTGDGEAVAKSVADEIGIDAFRAGLLPENKVTAVESLMNKRESKKGKLLFTGDGINDAPVLARADVGVAMGGIGSDAAIEAADVVIMDDKLCRIADAVAISRKTLRIVRQNIFFSLAVKFGVLIGAVLLPQMSMAAAIFADVGVMVLAVLNSMRALGHK